jgi:hypothetical protein
MDVMICIVHLTGVLCVPATLFINPWIRYWYICAGLCIIKNIAGSVEHDLLILLL